jgi:hypothetical protein
MVDESTIDTLVQIEDEPNKIIRLAENAEKWVEAMKRIQAAVLKLTHSGDWVDEGGNPYLQSSGAEKLIRPFGVCSKFVYTGPTPKPSEWKSLGEKGHYNYQVPMTVSIGNSSIDVIGRRSSKDVFFTTRYQYEAGQRVKVELPAEDVDENNVLGAAISNGLVNGISRLLGLRNLTWEELGKANIHPEKKVAYDGKKDPKTAKPEEEGDRTITENQNKRFYAIAKGQNISDAAIHAYLFDTYGLQTSKDIKTKDYDEIIRWAQAGGQTIKKEGGDD